MRIRLDSTDLALIKELETEARRSNSDLGIVLGVSEKTVRRRVQRLIEEQVYQDWGDSWPLAAREQNDGGIIAPSGGNAQALKASFN